MNEASTSGNFDIAWNHQVWGVQYYRITESGSADAVTDLTINEADYDQASNRYTYPVRGRINGSYTYQIQAFNEFGWSQPRATNTVDVAIQPQQRELTPHYPLPVG